ncbi:hypothetical protein FB45DRAFT_1056531 [Roridomyces roridus]|uniref:BTB domain-containing protein n=1 Tax=Roridomyces roridus TaxID=1738132 RepID=A0AAD7FNF9_9AGAR|nr:hypothetical protein FB45DRAFT_1056531 [Roridomyces roridus]
MSDTTPPAKRQRRSSATEDTTPIRSHIWKPFGDIVLQSEYTQFRVSRDILANQSPVFADMFTVPQPPNEPQVDGCPLVLLSGDIPKDWDLLLELLYSGRFVTVDDDVLSTRQLSAALRLGRKYRFDKAFRDAVGRFHSEFPTDLDQWYKSRGKLNTIRAVTFPYSITLWGLLIEAHMFGITKSIPAIALECLCVDSMETVIAGIERLDKSRIILPPALRDMLVVGFARILQFQVNKYSWLHDTSVIPSRLCVRKAACIRARHNLYHRLSRCEHANAYGKHDVRIFAFDVWEPDPVGEPEFCDKCAKAVEQAFDASRREAWECLPGFFGLAGWDKLKDACE